MCANCCSTIATRPMVIGKKDEAGNHLFPAYGTLEPNQIAIAIGERILKQGDWPEVAATARRDQGGAGADFATSPILRRAFPISAPAARIIHRPCCRKARAAMPASAATGWCSSSPSAIPKARRKWAARAPTGSARRRSRSASTCSRISATAPIIIRACSPSARRSPRASTSPTRSSTTMRSR